MKQIHSFDELRQIKDTKVYALGTFDGIHRGHQRVIRKAVEEAASVNGVSIIITFEHHPLTILHPERVPKRLIQDVYKRQIYIYAKEKESRKTS